MKKLILRLNGRAENAFALFEQICQEYGNLTLGELAKMSRHGYLILWEEK